MLHEKQWINELVQAICTARLFDGLLDGYEALS
jgi:hypothetical protein